MLSILIPIYNCNVVMLVTALNNQCMALSINYQILCFDDNSKSDFKAINSKISELTNVGYIELSENCGRAKIRNKLAKMARYDHLVFLDCDSSLCDDKFVSNYLNAIGSSKVIYGGRKYRKEVPDFDHLLHWQYGTKVESQPVEKRHKNPWLHFRSNNFYIHQSIFNAVRFDESITQYGHEDTLFALQLKSLGQDINHIDNAVYHDGLENNDIYIEKTIEGIENLAHLINSGRISDVRIMEKYHILKSWGLLPIFESLGQAFEPKLKNIIKKHPNRINLYQLWKLLIFIKKIKKPA